MTQGLSDKDQVSGASEQGAERPAKESDAGNGLSRLLGMLRRRDRDAGQRRDEPVSASPGTAAGSSPSAVVAQLQAEIAELEKRLEALEGDEEPETDQARMLQLLLRNRKDVLERAKARKFLLDGASYGVK
ncbi:MAG: hypothetical protein QNJ87_02370 [Gammaproteobacteria bacterium]|nr:hypothetical protein [Gammaproteobacteria bacterium]MDJ0870595.1 hypothetical protein [Gammaproteobacteria bacterium]